MTRRRWGRVWARRGQRVLFDLQSAYNYSLTIVISDYFVVVAGAILYTENQTFVCIGSEAITILFVWLV